jgi:hypothetical protein
VRKGPRSLLIQAHDTILPELLHTTITYWKHYCLTCLYVPIITKKIPALYNTVLYCPSFFFSFVELSILVVLKIVLKIVEIGIKHHVHCALYQHVFLSIDLQNPESQRSLNFRSPFLKETMWLVIGPFDGEIGRETSFQSECILSIPVRIYFDSTSNGRNETAKDQQVLRAGKKGPTVSDCL